MEVVKVGPCKPDHTLQQLWAVDCAVLSDSAEIGGEVVVGTACYIVCVS